MPSAPCWAKTPPGRSTRTMTVLSASACITIDTGIAHDVIIDAWWTRL